MTEKDNVSMATVQMKPDYAASEVYSTASEAPPAYKRQSNSVKIAKITAFTIIVSSFVLGSFILASSYLQAKASCDQVQALDSVLEKELMLETLQQVNKELPRAEALLGKETPDEVDLQNLDSNEPIKKVEIKQKNAPIPTEDEKTDNNYSDTEETEEMQKFPAKVPLELDLSDLAAALLQNNKKSRMNCVVERKHAEEIVDSPSKTVSLPFGMNLTTDPKKARITGERISIYCEGGNENKENEARESSRNNREEDEDTEEDVEPIRPVFIPYQRVPIPFGQIPQQFPLTHMPQRMMPPVQQPQLHMRQMLPPFQRLQPSHPEPEQFQQLPMRPPMPPQIMQAPHPEPQQQQRMMEPQTQTVRIHVQQLPFREIHVADDVPVQIPAQNQELPQFQVQRLPLGLALQRAGITADDLRNIQRMAEERITDELRRMAAVESSDSAENSNSNSSEEDDSADTQSSGQSSSAEQESMPPQQQQQPQQPPQPRVEQIPQRLILQPLPEQPRDTMIPPMPDQPPQMMQYGRAAYGRSLAQPVRIPVPMMQAQADMSQETHNNAPEERPHFVQPRSV